MSLAHQSIATISSPQFINLQPMDINPLMSSCQIKVLYVGTNRNGSYISKQVASEMAKTLRGAPIVGYFKKDKQDFADHGEQMIMDDEGIHFNCLTKPYGFVAPDAKVWFQDFEDFDEFQNSITRTYLMTTGFLWTGQFEQAQSVITEGKPHSMELDEKSLQGHWSTNIKENMEFFIINDAIFSKLCILGDDVEPCFEGSAVTAPQVSTSFTLDNQFKQTLFKMMEELKDALKGGNTVDIKNDKQPEKEITQVLDTNFTEEKEDKKEESVFTENEEAIENTEQEVNSDVNHVEEVVSDFEKQDDEEEENTEEDTAETSDDEEDEEDKKKYTELEKKYNALESEFNLLKEEAVELRAFKKEIENKQKDELIKEFYMLSDEDKRDVIEHKEEYTLEEIESKLAVICFKKKVNFNLQTFDKNEEDTETEKTVMTFNMDHTDDTTPDWVKEVELTMNNRI